jgi:hypothetical protein
LTPPDWSITDKYTDQELESGLNADNSQFCEKIWISANQGGKTDVESISNLLLGLVAGRKTQYDPISL